MVSDSDLVAAILIALLLLVVAFCAWPGFLRLRGRDLEGHWAAPGGGLYEVRDTGGRAVGVRAAGRGGPPAHGRLTGVRGLKIPSGVGLPPLSGRVELGGRRIHWKGGGVWARQGLA